MTELRLYRRNGVVAYEMVALVIDPDSSSLADDFAEMELVDSAETVANMDSWPTDCALVVEE